MWLGWIRKVIRKKSFAEDDKKNYQKRKAKKKTSINEAIAY